MATTITAWMIGGANWSDLDEDGLVKFLCEGENLNKDRIRNGMKRPGKARGGHSYENGLFLQGMLTYQCQKRAFNYKE